MTLTELSCASHGLYVLQGRWISCRGDIPFGISKILFLSDVVYNLPHLGSLLNLRTWMHDHRGTKFLQIIFSMRRVNFFRSIPWHWDIADDFFPCLNKVLLLLLPLHIGWWKWDLFLWQFQSKLCRWKADALTGILLHMDVCQSSSLCIVYRTWRRTLFLQTSSVESGFFFVQRC